jgi:hypothetical protein
MPSTSKQSNPNKQAEPLQKEASIMTTKAVTPSITTINVADLFAANAETLAVSTAAAVRFSGKLGEDGKATAANLMMVGGYYLGRVGFKLAKAIYCGTPLTIKTVTGEVSISVASLEAGKHVCPLCPNDFHGHQRSDSGWGSVSFPTKLVADTITGDKERDGKVKGNHFANLYGNTVLLLNPKGELVTVSATCWAKYCVPHLSALANASFAKGREMVTATR